jgi:HlyD family secretion protein
MMLVEYAISPAEIEMLRTGQAARVRFALVNRAATPEIAGKVIYAATDRSQDPETGAAFFLVRIEIDQAMVRKEALELRSGMPAEVFIETGKRSLISFVTKPIADQLARAFRE